MARTQIKKRRQSKPDNRSQPKDIATRGLHICSKEEWRSAKEDFQENIVKYMTMFNTRKMIKNRAIYLLAKYEQDNRDRATQLSA